MIPKWLVSVTVAGLLLCYIGILYSVYRIFALLADEVMTSQRRGYAGSLTHRLGGWVD